MIVTDASEQWPERFIDAVEKGLSQRFNHVERTGRDIVAKDVFTSYSLNYKDPLIGFNAATLKISSNVNGYIVSYDFRMTLAGLIFLLLVPAMALNFGSGHHLISSLVISASAATVAFLVSFALSASRADKWLNDRVAEANARLRDYGDIA